MGPARDPWQSQDQPVEQQSFQPADYGTSGKQAVSDPHEYGSPGRDFGGFNSMSGFGSHAGRATATNYWYSQPVFIIFIYSSPSAGATSNLRGPDNYSFTDAVSHGSGENGPQRLAMPPVDLPVNLMAANGTNDVGARTATARNIAAVVQNSAGVVPVRPVALANPVANPLITASASVHGATNVSYADPFEGLRDSEVYSNLAADVKVVAAQAEAEGSKIERTGDIDGSELASPATTVNTAPASKVLLAEIPFNLHGLEQAVQTVMVEAQRLGTEFTEWLEENQLTSAATIIAAAAAGSGAVFYLRRQAARAADRRDEEASSNWLFVQLQTAPSRD